MPLPAMNPEEDVPITCHCADMLNVDETITPGSAVVTVKTIAGSDPAPNNIKMGGPQIVGTDIIQRARNPVAGAKYRLIFKFSTSEGRILVGYEDMAVNKI